MSTHCYIGNTMHDRSIRFIYCNNNGFPKGVGQILSQHYLKPSKIDALLKLGTISVLGERIGRKTNFTQPTNGQCVAYVRDRGESPKENLAHKANSKGDYLDQLIADLTANAYAYLWTGDSWHITPARWADFEDIPPEAQDRWLKPGPWQELSTILLLLDDQEPQMEIPSQQARLFV